MTKNSQDGRMRNGTKHHVTPQMIIGVRGSTRAINKKVLRMRFWKKTCCRRVLQAVRHSRQVTSSTGYLKRRM